MIWLELFVELGVALMIVGASIIVAVMTGARPLSGCLQVEQKGLALLHSRLTVEQAEQYDSYHHFEVTGSDTGTRYRIRHGRMMNIDELDSVGRKTCEWCFLPEGNLVAGDCMLAQKIALETFESEALAIANRSSQTTWHQIEHTIEQSPEEPRSLLQWITRAAAAAITYCLIAAIVLIAIISGIHTLVPA
jgi:hypothetical protein